MDANKHALLQSSAFREILSDIRANPVVNPAKKLLPESYSMENRAIQQLRVEEFEKIMTSLELMGRDSQIKNVHATYGVMEQEGKKP